MNIEDIKKLRSLAIAADQPHSGVARDYFRQSVTAPRMLALLDLAEGQLNSFQQRVQPWMLACFGEMIAGDREERNHRFLEEALELVQSTGCTASEAHQLVDYVYGRPIGEPAQEVGGVMVTLAALCLANNLDMHADAETELARIWTKVEQIRAKQAAKPKHSPLPAHVVAPPGAIDEAFAAFCEREGYPSDGPFDAALRKAFAAGASQPPAPTAPVAEKVGDVVNEQAAFEVWARTQTTRSLSRESDNGPYLGEVVQRYWVGWQARAALAAQTAACAEAGPAKTHSDVIDFLIDCVSRSLAPDAMATECIKFFATQAAPAPADAVPADPEQAARSKWTVKQWYEHVGAWENAQGEVCFGSVMALGAMLKLMAKARHAAQSALALAGPAPVNAQLVVALEELIDQHVNGIAGISKPCIERARTALAAAGDAATAQTGMQGEALSAAVGKFIKAKGRFHTEQNYKALVAAYDAQSAARHQQEGGTA